MKLSMIVEITSWTPRFTFNRAGINAQRAPTATATRRIDKTWSTGGIE